MDDIEREILALVVNRGPLTGTAIADKLRIGSATLYPALYALEREQKIKSEWVEGPRPRRRVYAAIPTEA